MDGPLTSSVLSAIVSSPPSFTSNIPPSAQSLAHHNKDGKGFNNPWPSYRDMSAPRIIGNLLWRSISGQANSPDTTPPTVHVRMPSFLPTRETPQLRATWLGHACYLVEFPSGLRVLFDPVLTNRCSPFSFMGPSRYTEKPCQIRDIPFVDAVVISHSHYDHLSHPTVLEIKRWHPNAHFFAPLGNKKWFEESGIHNVTELDWWQSTQLTLTKPRDKDSKPQVGGGGGGGSGGSGQGNPWAGQDRDIQATLQALPCQHMSARTPFDRCRTLWASWSIESGGSKVWFGGDTGYRTVPKLPKHEDDYDPKHDFPHCPAFEEIGKYAGPFDLGLIPIGAYTPRFIMSAVHANPFDSVNIFVDTKCRYALGMHWGTWVLTEEDVLEPPRLLKEALRRKGIPEKGIFDVCAIGESRELYEDESGTLTAQTSKL